MSEYWIQTSGFGQILIFGFFNEGVGGTHNRKYLHLSVTED